MKSMATTSSKQAFGLLRRTKSSLSSMSSLASRECSSSFSKTSTSTTVMTSTSTSSNMLSKSKIRKSSSSLYLKDLGGSTSSFNSSSSQASLSECLPHGSTGCLESSFGSSSVSSLKELEEYCIRSDANKATSNESILCCSPTSVQKAATGDEFAWGHFTDLDESSSFQDLFLSFQPLPPSSGLSTLNETEEEDE